ncbi:hypothetical protein Tco_1173628 [Tanacetum coccineum]
MSTWVVPLCHVSLLVGFEWLEFGRSPNNDPGRCPSAVSEATGGTLRYSRAMTIVALVVTRVGERRATCIGACTGILCGIHADYPVDGGDNYDNESSDDDDNDDDDVEKDKEDKEEEEHLCFDRPFCGTYR